MDAGFQAPQVTTCLICRKAALAPGVTSVTMERGESKVIIRAVPADICPNCGEAYVDEKVAVRLLEDAEQISKNGEHENLLEY